LTDKTVAEERALARVSKDGCNTRTRGHPSRRLRSLSSGRASRGPGGKLLRMRSNITRSIAAGVTRAIFRKCCRIVASLWHFSEINAASGIDVQGSVRYA
jgi:hypothetical protein